MKVLLVEPKRNSRKKNGKILKDESLWYPPIGLMKIASLHKDHGDECEFTTGIDHGLIGKEFDRIYITTVFTFSFDRVVETIVFYLDNLCKGDKEKIFVGGIMATLMRDDIFVATGIMPHCGIIGDPRDIGLVGYGEKHVDNYEPDYSLVPNTVYAVSSTYYGYTTRGCINACPWCGVPKIEPKFVPYIDVKDTVRSLRRKHGDKPVLKLMDNNVLASPDLDKIVDDLLVLGYGKNNDKNRFVDFNQGLDASFFSKENIGLLSRLNVKPMRIAFDRLSEADIYTKAVKLAFEFGFTKFSNYMLYNCEDTPRELYQRLVINIELNREYKKIDRGFSIYSYPMRFAPIDERYGEMTNRHRDKTPPRMYDSSVDWRQDPQWTKRFIRNIEIMKNAAHGAISPTVAFAERVIGQSFDDFLTYLYMPEELLWNRDKHQKNNVRNPEKGEKATGYIEGFSFFLNKLLSSQDDKFWLFHSAVSQNSKVVVRKAMDCVRDEELLFWLGLYL